MNKTIICMLAGLVAFIPVKDVLAGNEKIYIMPKDVSCKPDKKEKSVRCFSKVDETPLTGELQRYREGNLVQQYYVKDGYLEGVAISKYTNGDLLSEKNYLHGQLDGVVKKYARDNVLQDVITYEKGVKTGIYKKYNENGDLVRQGIYKNDKLDGPTRLYDEYGNTVYEFIYKENKIVSGICSYIASRDSQELLQKNMTPEVIARLNKREIKPLPIVKVGGCAFKSLKKKVKP